MTLFRRFLSYAVVGLTLTYLIAVGTTYNGILNPQFRMVDLALFTLLPLIWLLARRGKTWHDAPLQTPILIWVLAILLSLIANTADARRILIGLWFVGVYVVLWLIAHDCIANRLIKRETLINSLLLVGVSVVLIGYVQIIATRNLLVRPVSVFGNTNVLATFLLLLFPLVFARLIYSKIIFGRVIWGTYSLSTLVLIVLTFSRGAWLGLALGLVVMGFWYLWERKWFSVTALLRRWRITSRRSRRAIVIGLVLFGVVALVGSAAMFTSLNEATRRLDLRTWIYDTALTMLREKPITGSGLFTFGGGLMRINSLPPNEPHAHAHNLFLQVAAELGLIGLVALCVTIGAVIRNVFVQQRNKSDALLWGGIGAITAVAGHHLLDFPSLMPAVTLSFLLVLAVLINPQNPLPRRSPYAQWLVVAGALALVVTGWWSAALYSSYYRTLQAAATTGNYHESAEALTPVVQTDSLMPVYVQQQGMLYGLSALTDPDDLSSAINAFERYVALEPYSAIGWANLGALYGSQSYFSDAVNAMRQASLLAPRDWNFPYQAATYAEADGDTSTANNLYYQALYLNPELPLWPEWNTSITRQGLTLPKSDIITLVDALMSNDTTAAEVQWETMYHQGWPQYQILELFLRLRQQNADGAEQILEAFEGGLPEQLAWYHIGQALLARYQGQPYENELAAVRDLILVDPLETDFVFGANINYVQFLRLAIPRQFLPQVEYRAIDPALAHILEGFEGISFLP